MTKARCTVLHPLRCQVQYCNDSLNCVHLSVSPSFISLIISISPSFLSFYLTTRTYARFCSFPTCEYGNLDMPPRCGMSNARCQCPHSMQYRHTRARITIALCFSLVNERFYLYSFRTRSMYSKRRSTSSLFSFLTLPFRYPLFFYQTPCRHTYGAQRFSNVRRACLWK